jgi:pimeloyl-ACP methyl ester carboxylesterase
MPYLYNSATAQAAIYDWYDDALQQLTIPAHTRTVRTDWGRTHVVITGNPAGPPVVLVHGLNNNALIWRPQLEGLTDFCLYAVDIPGQPGRSEPNAPSLHGDASARWLLQTITALDLPAPALVGLSLGGFIVTRLAAYAPAHVGRLALIAPAGYAPLRLRMLTQIAAANLPLRDYNTVMRNVMRQIFITPGREPEDTGDDAMQLLRLVNRYEPPIRTPQHLLEAIRPAWPLPSTVLNAVNLPALLMIGAEDALFDATTVCQRAQANLPHLVAAECYQRAGHAMTYEIASIVNARLSTFLRDGT